MLDKDSYSSFAQRLYRADDGVDHPAKDSKTDTDRPARNSVQILHQFESYGCQYIAMGCQ